MTTADLPALNACLNGTSFVLLILGWLSIRRKRVRAHRFLMCGAVSVSALFLVSYIVHKVMHGSTSFAGQGLARTGYLLLLASHSILAAALVPFVLVVLRFALTDRIPKHRRLARIVLPIWLYVSMTGVVVYLLLYDPFRT